MLDESQRDASCSITGLFLRRCNVICQYLVGELCGDGELKCLLDEAPNDRSSPTDMIMSRFGSLADLFDYRTAQGQPDALT